MQNKFRSLVLFAVSLGLGLVFNWFFYEKIPGISMTIFIAILAAALPLAANAWGVRLPRNAWLALFGAVLFASWVAVRTSPFLSVLNVIFSLYLIGMAVLLTAERFDWGKIFSFIRIPFLPLNFISKIPWSVARMTEFRSRGEGKGAEVIRGILMALPVLFVFILLFASADLVIHDFFLRLFNIENLPEVIGRTVIVLVFSLFAAGTLGYALSSRTDVREEGSVAKKEQWKLGTLQVSVFLGAIATLFLGFILVQAAYLFGGESALAGRDFTYAEYARHGFFELLAVALITFLLLWGSERSVMRSAEKHSRQFKGLAGALALEVVLIIASAFMRLSLYESAFGFTTMRLWSHAFTVLLTAFFLIFAWKIWRDADDRSFLVPAFFAAALSLLFMNVLSPDVFIARKNIARFASDERFDSAHRKQFDAAYIAYLSDDATQEKLQVLRMLRGEDKAAFGQIIAHRYEQRLQLTEEDSWQSWNYARRRADSQLQARSAEFEEYKETPEGGDMPLEQ